MKLLVAIILFIFITAISFIIAFVTWKYADYFLSKRDFYVNSRYSLFSKKMGWVISAFLISIGILSNLSISMLSVNDKNIKTTTNDFILYERPNNKSKILFENNSKTEVKILNETKFYYQIEFYKGRAHYSGFIRKDKITN
jgi:hypothetical protein